MNRNFAVPLLAVMLTGCATVAPAVHRMPHKAATRASVARHEAQAPVVVPVPIAEPAPVPAPSRWKWFH